MIYYFAKISVVAREGAIQVHINDQDGRQDFKGDIFQAISACYRRKTP